MKTLQSPGTRRRVALARCACTLLLAALAGCRRDVDPRPSFLVISLDTTRADHLGVYGYERDTTPMLDALAARGLVFEQMISASENTLISHASLFTGLYPAAHGTTWRDGGTALNPEYHTLAEDFREAGYQTAAFTAHDIWLSREFGVDQGFEHFVSSEDDADVVLERARRWLAERDPQRPFLLFVHLFDVHTKAQGRPYQAKPPFTGRYTSDYDGPLADWGDEPVWEFMYSIPDGRVDVSARDLQYLADQYDEALAYTDDRVGRFLADLPADVARATWISVTADHGEEFMEHGGILHTGFFDEVVRIPWILVPPPTAGERLGAPRRVSEQVRLVDVRPTLSALAGLPAPAHCQGQDLVPWLAARPAGAEPSASSSRPAPIYDAALRADGYKLYRTEEGTRLFDLARDPRERYDVSADPEVRLEVASLARRLEELVRESEALRREILAGADEALPPEDPDRARELKSLGYVEGDAGRE